MRAFAVHFGNEFRAGLRNPSSLLMNYLFPLGFYALMGLVMTQLNPGFKQAIVPAMAVFALMVATVLGLPGPLVEMRNAGIYRSYRTIGVPALSALLMPAVTALIHGSLTALLVVLTAPRFFGGAAPAHPLALAGVLVVGGFAFASIALLLGVVSPSSRASVLLTQGIFLPSMLLGGMMVPFAALPASVRPFALLLPTAHVMQAAEGLAYGRPTVIAPGAALAVLATAGVLALVLSAFLFEWDPRGGTRRGRVALALLAAAPFVVAALVS